MKLMICSTQLITMLTM